MVITRVKRFIRRIQGLLERYLLGSFLQEWIWRLRHLYQRNWAKEYLDSTEHFHRRQVVETVASFDDVASVLEVGCASGANLIRLRELLPHAQLSGIDISRHGINAARDYFGQRGDKKIFLKAMRADNLSEFESKSVDVVFSDAVLIYLAPKSIRKVLFDMSRIAVKGIVLNEYHKAGESIGHFNGGCWIYDYSALIRECLPDADISIEISDYSGAGGLWGDYGRLITVRL